MAEIDETILVNHSLPKKWRCPHCGKITPIDHQAEEIFLEFFMVLRQCPGCGYVHCWKLELTEDFKRKVISYLEQGL